jgi:putative transposase
MNNNWKNKNRHKYLLQYHLIFLCKYRKKLLSNRISDDIKQLSYNICNKHNIIIKHIETDKDHIHYMEKIHRKSRIKQRIYL